MRREYYTKEEEEEEWCKEITKSVTREVLVGPHTLAREIQELGGGVWRERNEMCFKINDQRRKWDLYEDVDKMWNERVAREIQG